MTVQNHYSNMYHDALNKVSNTRHQLNINDKINLICTSRIGMNGVLRFYSNGVFNKIRCSVTMNKQ